MTYQTGPRIVTNGLVFCVDAADANSYAGSGTTWTDLSGNGNNGTLTNGPTFSSANRGSIVFDGTNDYVDCGNSSILNFTNNFTIAAWINRRTTQVSIDSALVGKITSNDSYSGYMLWYNGNTIDLYAYQSIRANSTTTIQANTWYFIVGTYDGIIASLYINGILDKATTTTFSASASGGNFWIGGYYSNGAPRYFTGDISNAQAYNRALSASEVAQNYNATKGRYNL